MLWSLPFVRLLREDGEKACAYTPLHLPSLGHSKDHWASTHRPRTLIRPARTRSASFPLLPISSSVTSPRMPSSNGTRSAFHTPILSSRVDLPLLALTFVSGLLDASVYTTFTVFASMQTGNSIFLALGASGQPANRPFAWLKSLVSIAAFACGAFACRRLCTTWPGRWNATSRGTLSVSGMLQAAVVAVVAGLVQAGVLPGKRDVGAKGGASSALVFEWAQLAVVGLLACQAGAQIATSRMLGVKEMPTTVLTSVYADLVMDPGVFLFADGRWREVGRARRVGSIVSLILGGIVGGWITKSSAGFQGCLWLVAATKALVAVNWWAFRGRALGSVQRIDEEQDEGVPDRVEEDEDEQ